MVALSMAGVGLGLGVGLDVQYPSEKLYRFTYICR